MPSMTLPCRGAPAAILLDWDAKRVINLSSCKTKEVWEGHGRSRLGEWWPLRRGHLCQPTGRREPKQQEGTPPPAPGQPGGKADLSCWKRQRAIALSTTRGGGWGGGTGLAGKHGPWHTHPCPCHSRHLTNLSSPNVCQPCQGVPLLFALLLGRPLQMDRRWETHHCTVLAPGLAGPGHCLRL